MRESPLVYTSNGTHKCGSAPKTVRGSAQPHGGTGPEESSSLQYMNLSEVLYRDDKDFHESPLLDPKQAMR